MAVISTPVQSNLRIVVQTGTDLKGNPVYRNRSYSRVKPAALDQDVFEVAGAIAGLQKNTLQGIQRIATNDLTQE
jgi:hypothetical protein